MLYLEQRPIPELAPYIDRLWYTSVPHPVDRLQRVLPTGQIQIVISLAREHLTSVNPVTGDLGRDAPALLTGVHDRSLLINTVDLGELAGVLFRPGGAAALLACPADLVRNRELPLPDICGPEMHTLRDRLREAATPAARLGLLQGLLLRRLHASPRPGRQPAVRFALRQIARCPGAPIATLSHDLGMSPRCFAELFRQEVGVTPRRPHVV